MHQVMVRYKVKPERVSENEALVRAVYEQLAAEQPAGFEYSTYRLEDGVSFVHVSRSEQDRPPLGELEAFQRFQHDVAERCDEPPVVTQLETIGSYRAGPA
ncbi:MAG: hypothetical protein ACJ76X_07695 [Solirubrobacteraceae bacterium]